MLRSNLHFLTLTFLLVIGACDSSKGETASATESTTDATTESTTGSTTDDSTTDEPTTTVSVSAGGSTGDDDPTVATSGEDTEGDTTSSTTGPVDPEHQSACEAACQRMAECDDTIPVAECVVGCTEEFQEMEAGCVPANLALVQCASELSCLDMESPTKEGPCADELEALLDCDGGNCTVGLDEGDDACGVTLLCDDAPTQRIECIDDTCTCFEDEVQVAQCAADGVCLEGDAIFDKMNSCCEFE